MRICFGDGVAEIRGRERVEGEYAMVSTVVEDECPPLRELLPTRYRVVLKCVEGREGVDWGVAEGVG